jgi:Lon protease-like protein
MSTRGSDISPDSLPDAIPVFPLPGVLLLPRGQLPLNIFEPRYLAMVDDALKSDRIIGMIQPRDDAAHPALYQTGCAGKITMFEETKDDRYLITLTGISRFNVRDELELRRGYRRVVPDWSPFAHDFEELKCLDIDRGVLKEMLVDYFSQQGIQCDIAAVDSAPDEKLITCLSMICPFDASEKQALLEAKCCRERARKFMTLLKMALHPETCCDNGYH